MTDFSKKPPVLILKNLNGGIPNLIGIGNNQGTPSLVKVSVIRWDTNPIIKQFQTKSISTRTTFCSAPKRISKITPNKTIPIIEWEINLCPPKNGEKIFPKTPPAGSLLQRSAVGWSISGASAPINPAPKPAIRVESFTGSISKLTKVKESAVKAAKS